MEYYGRKFPNTLREFRRKFGYTQSHVAGLLGHTDRTRLASWENGTAQPSLDNAIKLGIIYRTIPNELFPEKHKRHREEIAILETQLLVPRSPDRN